MAIEVLNLLKQMLESGASDLYIKVGCPPFLRINGRLVSTDLENITPSIIDTLIREVVPSKELEKFDSAKELDYVYSVSGLGRFRYNLFIQRGTYAMVFRSIRTELPSFESLNLPIDTMKKLTSEPRGLVLITGHAGSGKSTTLAAMTDYINNNFQKHIITIEDPIEFVHSDKKSIISQREIGIDTIDFNRALRHIIRQTPDVILIGEMRDLETVQIAIMAAETGHLVFSTLHTIDTAQTVDRIINFFPPYAHTQIRLQLSMILKGVISQRLIPRADGRGRVPACEVMLNSPTISKLISEGDTKAILPAIENSRLFGMQSFNQSIAEWLKTSAITKEAALTAASNPGELSLMLKDIFPSRGMN